MKKIILPNIYYSNGLLIGNNVEKVVRKIKDLNGLFDDEASLNKIDPDTIVYEVSSHLEEKEGREGGLFFGITYLYPGKVGNEYFMTKGHYHAKIDRTEYYWGIEGEGVLILMDEDRNVCGEKIFPGSLHYIKSGIAHRVANTGTQILSFGACWPSDAGHCYDTIAKNGFSARLREINGTAVLEDSKKLLYV